MRTKLASNTDWSARTCNFSTGVQCNPVRGRVSQPSVNPSSPTVTAVEHTPRQHRLSTPQAQRQRHRRQLISRTRPSEYVPLCAVRAARCRREYGAPLEALGTDREHGHRHRRRQQLCGWHAARIARRVDCLDDWIEFVEQRVDHDTDLADRVIDGDLFSVLDWVNIANCDQGFHACPRSFGASAEREHRSRRKWLRVCCDTLCAPIKARLGGSR